MVRRLIPFVVIVLWTSHNAYGQAWVGGGGSLSANLDYNFVRSSHIVETPDLSVAPYPVTMHAFILGAEYVPLDRWAVSANLTLATIKLSGEPNAALGQMRHGPYDDGDYHTTPTDLRVGTRYQILDEPYVALSPHVGVSVPVADYATSGYAAAGRHLKQLHLGASLGRTLSPWVPALYLHAMYEFSLVEKFDATPETEAIGQNRSDLGFLLGYVFLDGRLDVNVGYNYRLSHGGINFVDFLMYDASVRLYHDALLREEFSHVGAGVSFAITETVQVNALARFFISGYNTRDNDIFAVGVAWSPL